MLLSDGRDSYRRVKQCAARLPGFVLSDARWDSLLLPINLAFFYFSSAAGRVIAVYPSPAGAMESLLELKTWDEVLSDNPLFAELEPDVEALLVNRVGQSRDYYRISIDHCYQPDRPDPPALARPFRRQRGVEPDSRASSSTCNPANTS